MITQLDLGRSTPGGGQKRDVRSDPEAGAGAALGLQRNSRVFFKLVDRDVCGAPSSGRISSALTMEEQCRHKLWLWQISAVQTLARKKDRGTERMGRGCNKAAPPLSSTLLLLVLSLSWQLCF